MLLKPNLSLRALLIGTLLTGLTEVFLAQTPSYFAAPGAIAIDTAYPYNIALVASRGLQDTSLLSSADAMLPHLGKRPVVMFFWMTTCGPCRMELEEISQRMDAWQRDYDFAFIPISLDFDSRRAAFHGRAADYPWTSYYDIFRAFPSVMPGGLNGVPQIFIFDKAGEQIFYRRKYREGDLEALEAALAEVGSRH